MKSAQPSATVALEKLRPSLLEKIEHMDGAQLQVLENILLQLEAETLAERLGDAFEHDQQAGKLRRIPDLVRKIRGQHRPA